MPRAKSSAELDAEIQEMQKKLADKKKEAQAAKRREKAEADRIKAVEKAEFNRDFVEATKTIRLSDYTADGRTIYELIRAIIRPPVVPEPDPVSQVSPEPDDLPGGNEELYPSREAYASQTGMYSA